MTKDEWIAKAKANADALRSLLSNYHPVMLRPGDTMPITAMNAELMCQKVRSQIIRQDPLLDPVQEFDAALEQGDIQKIGGLLNAAWFGVPESTSCWRIEGFTEAVDLLDDPPDPEEAA